MVPSTVTRWPRRLKNGLTQLSTLALTTTISAPSPAALSIVAKPSGRKRQARSEAKRRQRMSKSSSAIPPKKWAKSRCFILWLDTRRSLISTSSGKWATSHATRARRPQAKATNSISVSRVVSVPSKSKA